MSVKNFIVAPKNLINKYPEIMSLNIYNFDENQVIDHIKNTYVYLPEERLEDDEEYEKEMMKIIQQIDNMQPNQTIVFPGLQKHPECCTLTVKRKN